MLIYSPDGHGADPKGVEVFVLKDGDYSGWKLKQNTNGGNGGAFFQLR